MKSARLHSDKSNAPRAGLMRWMWSVGLLLVGGLCPLAGGAGVPAADTTPVVVGGGMDQQDADAMIRRALAGGAREIVIAPGRYTFGPAPLVVPDGAVLRGQGEATVLVPAEGTTVLLKLGSDCRLENLRIDGSAVKRGSATEAGLVQATSVARVTVAGVTFVDVDRICIGTDNAADIAVRRCLFERVGMAVNLVYSRRARIADNRVIDARMHGIQAWGAWRPVRDGTRVWERKACEDISVTGNYVKNGGQGAIWGSGVRWAIFANNIVDGAKDVGLDLEWSEDSVINANTVRNCVNAGIALFFTCERINITGNTVINDHPLPEKAAAGGWWVRSGIWLTSPNRKEFPEDFGHRDITITGNTIIGDGARRRGIWIGRDAQSVAMQANTFSHLGIEHEK